MNIQAMLKQEICRNLAGLPTQDLHTIADLIAFMRQKKHLKAGGCIKFQGILSGYDIDLGDLKALRKKTWDHLDGEFLDG